MATRVELVRPSSPGAAPTSARASSVRPAAAALHDAAWPRPPPPRCVVRASSLDRCASSSSAWSLLLQSSHPIMSVHVVTGPRRPSRSRCCRGSRSGRGSSKCRGHQGQHLQMGKRRRADAGAVGASCCRRSRGSSRCCPWSPRCPRQASPGGITGPQLTPRKWSISVSMSCMVRSLSGGVASGWSRLVGAGRHAARGTGAMIRRLWRISSTAHRRRGRSSRRCRRSAHRTRTGRSRSRAASCGSPTPGRRRAGRGR